MNVQQLNKEQVVLAALASAAGEVFTPVQIQKLLFLLERRLWPNHELGPYFNFAAYDYGPFDADVYVVLENLQKKGLVEIFNEPHLRWNKYKSTTKGAAEGKAVLQSLGEDVRNYLQALSEFVRGLSFAELVGAIYKAYPEMKVNSVFRG
jgi:hypothetical protein